MAIVILSNAPVANDTQVVLQTAITVAFSTPIPTAYVNSDTFVLYTDGTVVYKETGGQLGKANDPYKYTDVEYVKGSFTCSSGDAVSGYCVHTFTPTKPLKANMKYTVIVAGKDTGAKNGNKYIKSLGGVDWLEKTVRWTFNTGELSVATPPDISQNITFEEFINEIGLVDDSPGSIPNVVVSPKPNSVHVAMIDDVLYTITSKGLPISDNVSYSVFLTSIDDPLSKKIELPTTYEVLEDGRVLKIKFA